MARAQMSLGMEQSYAQKRLQLAEDKSKCKIWTRSKYDEIVDLMTKEKCKEDKTPAYYYLFKKYVYFNHFTFVYSMTYVSYYQCKKYFL